MSSWRATLICLLGAAATICASATLAAADEEPFLSFTASELAEFELWEDSQFAPAGRLYYNRVDGLLVYFGAQYRSDTKLHPRLTAVLGWPSAHDESYYQIDVEQPIHSQDSFSFGVSLYDKTAWSREDEENISDFGNNLQAFFAREDDRDYFRADGATVFVQHKATPDLTFRVEYRSDRLSSMREREHIWTAFGRDDDWRDNPALEMGVLDGAEKIEGPKRMNSYVWTIAYDTRSEDETSGWYSRLIAEFGGKSSGGDYDFRKHVLDVTKIIPITSTQTLTLRGIWGKASGTDFPSHKLFHLGGRGDLRGYDYKEFGGKDLLFGRAEYKIDVTEPLDMIYFLESGDVGYGSTPQNSNDSDGHRQDVGIGFRVEAPWAGWFRVDVARAIQEEADVKVYVSLLLET